MKILVLDNYDSFTYNLVQYIERLLKKAVDVKRNDQIKLEEVALYDKVLISPGPGIPEEAGITLDLIRKYGPLKSILGVCLGHQAIAASYGAKVVRADRIMHGKTSMIFHDGCSIFKGLTNPFEAVRYHSLIVCKDTVPDCLEITAWTAEGEIMGLRHRRYPVEGVQFHPESILTEAGENLLQNFSLNGGKCHD